MKTPSLTCAHATPANPSYATNHLYLFKPRFLYLLRIATLRDTARCVDSVIECVRVVKESLIARKTPIQKEEMAVSIEIIRFAIQNVRARLALIMKSCQGDKEASKSS